MEARMKMYLIFSRVYLLFYSSRKKSKGKACKVLYQDVYGLRESKYDYLDKSMIFHTTEWKKLKPSEPYYFFVEKDFSLAS